MVGFVLGIIVSIVFLFLFITASKENKDIKKYKTKATIYRIIYSDAGNVRYYIQFNKDKREMKGQTIYYKKANRKYHEGDSVEIYYYYTKDKKIMAEVIDDDLVPCSKSLKYGKYILLLFAIFFFVVSIISLIKWFC